MYKQTDRIVNKTTTHRFTSSAFVLSPFAGSPLHLNQNFNSSFLSSDGFQPNNEAPGISSSERLKSHISTSVAMLNVRLFHPGLTSLTFVLVVTIPPEPSAIMKVVYNPDNKFCAIRIRFPWKLAEHCTAKSPTLDIF